MTESLNNLIEALRDELTNYGEMLLLLDYQQTHLRHRNPAEVSQSISNVRAQGLALQAARDRREECFQAVLQDWGQFSEAGFTDLIPLLPMEYQPLVTALVDENHELLFHVRHHAQENHLILKRSVTLMQQVLIALCPGAPPESNPSPIMKINFKGVAGEPPGIAAVPA